ncbi:transcription factor bHLH53-like [Salvia splendens]|uniref:transcription factor bHLH53-like n=1 Tax=Salvia splendens TaxID=180675 RepID=UPI001C27F5DC|nr:transcription factor bHLH53-like [Salvia splendens]
MALSYYPNWPEFSAAIDDPDLQSLSFNPDDYLVDPNDSSFCNSLLLSDFDHTTTQPPPFFPLSKRQKFCDSQQFFDYQPPEFFIPAPAPTEFPAADFGVRVKEERGGGGSLSAQSIAARQRRRRITVKTQELGKLVPGGTKMNTAEMLQSAYKYIKFLQAQVALLGLAGSLHREESPLEDEEEFQNLLESPLIQEKLYSTEHCLVPQKLVEQHQLLKSNPHFLEMDN